MFSAFRSRGYYYDTETGLLFLSSPALENLTSDYMFSLYDSLALDMIGWEEGYGSIRALYAHFDSGGSLLLVRMALLFEYNEKMAVNEIRLSEAKTRRESDRKIVLYKIQRSHPLKVQNLLLYQWLAFFVLHHILGDLPSRIPCILQKNGRSFHMVCLCMEPPLHPFMFRLARKENLSETFRK